jgi:hypothetical protein
VWENQTGMMQAVELMNLTPTDKAAMLWALDPRTVGRMVAVV